MSCPLCRMLKDGKDTVGKLCSDCKANQNLVDEWMWYEIIKQHVVHFKIYIIVYPILVLMAVCSTHLVIDLTHLMDWFMLAICIGSWVLSIWMYRKKDYEKLVMEQREKLFMIKLKGVRSSIG